MPSKPRSPWLDTALTIFMSAVAFVALGRFCDGYHESFAPGTAFYLPTYERGDAFGPADQICSQKSSLIFYALATTVVLAILSWAVEFSGLSRGRPLLGKICAVSSSLARVAALLAVASLALMFVLFSKLG